MSNTTLTLAMFLSITLLVLTPAASAQSVVLRADIPFDFYIGDTLMPLGNYMIEATNPDVLRFRHQDGKANFVLLTQHVQNAQPNATSSLLFKRYGDSSFLANVYWQGYPTARVIQPTPRQLEIARQFTGGKSVVVAGK